LSQEAVWSGIFAYPEYGQTDVVREMRAQDMLVDHLAVMFPEKGDGEVGHQRAVV